MSNPYNQNKAALHPLKVLDLREGRQPYPVHVQIVLSDLCNQDCHFCAYRLGDYINNELFKIINPDGSVTNNPQRMIPWPKLKEIIEDCAAMGVRAVQVTGGGEPTVHPRFDDFCKLVSDRGMDLGVVTNGLLLPDERAELLARACWVRVSLDGGTPATYARIRNVGEWQFHQVAENVRRLAAAERRVCLGIGFVITRENYREIGEACLRYKDWGADYVQLSAFFQNDGVAYYEGIVDDIHRSSEKVECLRDEHFEVYNNFSARLADLNQGAPDYQFCGMMNLTTYIGGDQNVYTCCNNAYSPRGLIGSIAGQSFKALWDGDAKHAFFRDFDARGCERCMFNVKNRNILELIQEARGHDNFV